MWKMDDIAGRKFGRLLALWPVKQSKNGAYYWLAQCEEGNLKIVEGKALRTGTTQSCGCYCKDRIREVNTIHGHSSGGKTSPTYNSWWAMIKRCANLKNPHYGAKGITVCERWKVFENFLADMGERPPDMTLDRFPNRHGNYEPGNCRWATDSQQNKNRDPFPRRGKRWTMAQASM